MSFFSFKITILSSMKWKQKVKRLGGAAAGAGPRVGEDKPAVRGELEELDECRVLLTPLSPSSRNSGAAKEKSNAR